MAVGQEAVVDLQHALLAIAIVPQRRQRAGHALEIARAQVVQRHGVAGEMARRQLLLDAALAREQPIHGGVELVLVGLRDPEELGQGRGVPPARGRQLRLRAQDAGGDHRHDELARARGPCADQALEAQSLHGGEHGVDVAVQPRAPGHDLEQVLEAGERLALEDAPDQRDLAGRQPGEIGPGALPHAGPVPEGLAQQHRWGWRGGWARRECACPHYSIYILYIMLSCYSLSSTYHYILWSCRDHRTDCSQGWTTHAVSSGGDDCCPAAAADLRRVPSATSVTGRTSSKRRANRPNGGTSATWTSSRFSTIARPRGSGLLFEGFLKGVRTGAHSNGRVVSRRGPWR